VQLGNDVESWDRIFLGGHEEELSEFVVFMLGKPLLDESFIGRDGGLDVFMGSRLVRFGVLEVAKDLVMVPVLSHNGEAEVLVSGLDDNLVFAFPEALDTVGDLA
jgi:hypothetical protein